MGHCREDYFCHEEDLKTRHRRHAGGPSLQVYCRLTLTYRRGRMSSLTAMLTVKDARGAVDFYARAFGASEQSSRRPLAELASG